MIVDTLENLEKYVSLNPYFKVVVDFLKSNDLSKLQQGKHFIDGKDLFVNITTAKGKTKEDAVMESHKNMIDIQIPLNVSETYGYTPLNDLPDMEYNAEIDCTKYPGVTAQSYVTCTNKMFAIFFPQDGHAPCISSEPEILKAIFKVKA